MSEELLYVGFMRADLINPTLLEIAIRGFYAGYTQLDVIGVRGAATFDVVLGSQHAGAVELPPPTIYDASPIRRGEWQIVLRQEMPSRAGAVLTHMDGQYYVLLGMNNLDIVLTDEQRVPLWAGLRLYRDSSLMAARQLTAAAGFKLSEVAV